MHSRTRSARYGLFVATLPRSRCRRPYDVGRERDQIGRVRARAVGIGRSPAVVDRDVAALGPAQFLEPLQEAREASLFFGTARWPAHEQADAAHPLGLFARAARGPASAATRRRGNEVRAAAWVPRTRIAHRPKRITLRPCDE